MPTPRASLAALVLGAGVALAACSPRTTPPVASSSALAARPYDAARDSLRFAGEAHVRNIRQLTFGGNNAEAYWSFDSRQLIFQSDWDRINSQGCDQQYVMNADGSPIAGGTLGRYRQVSTGTGRTTCGYFLADGRVVFASTHATSRQCPSPAPASAGRYVWSIYDSFDIYVANADGSNVQPLITGPGYDAEATVSPDGKTIVFTSTRSGDLELWSYDLATGATRQLTDTPGYDGGAFFSRDSKQLVWRASRPTGDELASYRSLLAQGMVEPREMRLFVADADGSNARQVTDLPGANWAPFFHPDGQRILFASNHESMIAGTGGRIFAIWMVNTDGTGLRKIVDSGTFDAFPMFSPDGTKLVFASNRNVARTPSRETNVFVADWVETPTAADTGFRPLVTPAPGAPRRPGSN